MGQQGTQIDRKGNKVQTLKKPLDSFGTHASIKTVTVRGASLLVLFLVEDLTLLQTCFLAIGVFDGGIFGINNNIILEVDDLLELIGFHVEQSTQPAGHRLEEPDMNHWCGEVDMAHPFAAHPAMGHLDTALVADHPFIFHAAVFTAGAFPVFFRPEDPLAEEPITLRTVGAVVDGFGFFHLAVGPRAPNVVGISQADPYRRIIVDTVVIHVRGSTTSGVSIGRVHHHSPDGPGCEFLACCGGGTRPLWDGQPQRFPATSNR